MTSDFDAKADTMISKLVCTFLVLSIFSVILQSEGCFWGSGCSKRDCSMSSWLSWSTCSQPCGTGAVQTRSRKVIRAAKCGGSCWSLEQSRPCNTVCPNGGTPVDLGCLCKTGYSGKCCTGVDGRWSSWGNWTKCTKTCEIGIQARTRKCTQPPPRNGGKRCEGAAREQRKCNTQPCAVDDGWSDWSEWNSCSKSCGTGFQERSRNCTKPAPENGGKTCQGEAQEKRLCHLPSCPVDGGWSEWSEWTSCSESCGGIQERSRNCTSPEPSFGGKPCEGEARETHECENHCVDIFGHL